MVGLCFQNTEAVGFSTAAGFSTLQDAVWPFLSCLFQNTYKMEIVLLNNFFSFYSVFRVACCVV